MSILASDNFNRADENPLASPWLNQGGFTSELASNILNFLILNPNADQQYLYSGPTWPADQYSKAAITAVGSGGAGAGPGVGARFAGSNTKTFYRCVVDSGGQVELGSFVLGSYTIIWDRAVTIVNGATLELRVVGSTLSVFYNGAQVGADSTDATLASGSAGIAYSSTETTTATLDNWEGGDFTSNSGDIAATGLGAALFVANPSYPPPNNLFPARHFPIQQRM